MTNGRQPVSDPSSFATSTERHLADIVDAPLNLHEYDAAARAALPTMIYDYIARGAGDEVTLRRPPSGAGWRAARLAIDPALGSRPGWPCARNAAAAFVGRSRASGPLGGRSRCPGSPAGPPPPAYGRD
jgi:hypothetical protein